MASPQLENGHTRIANELLEKLTLFPFPNKTTTPLKLCLLVIRKTYGYHKKLDCISLKQFQRGTGSNRSNIVHWLKYLVSAGILVKSDTPNKNGYFYGINKNWEEWKWLVPVLELVSVRHYPSISANTTPSTSADTRTSIPANTHKRKKDNIKDNITKDKANLVRNDINQLMSLFEQINPTLNYGNKTQRLALEELIKKMGYEKAQRTIKYAVSVQGQPYSPTITTPYQLKEKLSQLIIYNQKENSKPLTSKNYD